jgi:hypothetical protein
MEFVGMCFDLGEGSVGRFAKDFTECTDRVKGAFA